MGNVLACVCALLAGWAWSAHATNYYIDKDHGSASDAHAGTSESLPWLTITKANTTLVAGDTVYIKAGTYTAGTNNYVRPTNSGTAVLRITYRNYGTDVVTIQQGNFAVYLNGNDYITVQGLIFTQLDQYLDIFNGGTYNIIDGNTFTSMRTYTGWEGSTIRQSSHHNILRNNTFSEYGRCNLGSDDGAVLEIGNENVGGDASDYNLIENNVIARGGHHVIGLHSRYNVMRNNYFYNDGWQATGKGNRTLYMTNVDAASTGFNLLENNRTGYSAVPCDAAGVQGAMIASSSNIVRYNSFYHNNLNGLGLQVYDIDTSLNLIYNNTFFNNASVVNPSYGASQKGAITLGKWNPPAVVNNRIKNNLFYSHPYDGNQPIGENGALRSNQTIEGNYDGDVSGNPLFVNASTTFPSVTDQSVPNLNLQATSPAINIGTNLTTVSSGCSGSTSSIVLADATYFQDGTWGTGGTVLADWIAVGTVTNTKQIASISGNTVTLASALSCANSDSVWLYKDSTGRQVLYGSAPDVGAYEYGDDVTPPAIPTGVMITRPPTPQNLHFTGGR